MRLSRIRLRNYGILAHLDIQMPQLLTVFGANGSGKTMLLDGIEQGVTGAPFERRAKNAVSQFSAASIEIEFEMDDLEDRESHLFRVIQSLIGDSTRNEFDARSNVPSMRFALAEYVTRRYEDELTDSQVQWVYKLTESMRLIRFKAPLAHTRSPYSWRIDCIIKQHDLRESLHGADPDVARLAQSFGPENLDLHTLEPTLDASDFADLLEGRKLATLQIPLIQFVEYEKYSQARMYMDMDAFGLTEFLDPVSAEKFAEEVTHDAVRGFGNSFNELKPLILRLEEVRDDFENELETGIEQVALTLVTASSRSSAQSIIASPTQMTKEFDTPHGDEDEEFDENAYLDSVVPTPWIQSTQDGNEFTFKINPAIRKAIGFIEARTNAILPSFIAETCSVVLELRHPTRWTADSQKVGLCIREGDQRVPFRLLSSGVKKYIAISLKLAIQELLTAKKVIIDPEAEGDEDYVFQFAGQDEELLELFHLVATRSNTLLLVDEPEAHLHPRAVASVAHWLKELSGRTAGVVVASHHPSFFDLRGIGVRRTVLSKRAGTSHLENWSDLTQEAARDLAMDVGLSEGDLFLMSKYFLLVEGPHDAILLNAFYGDLFRNSGIRILPLHGLDRTKSLIESELIWVMGIPMGVLADNVGGLVKSHEESQLKRLVREVEAAGRSIDVWGLPKLDILDYLAPEVVSRFSNGSFTNWDEARNVFSEFPQSAEKGKKKISFKEWVAETYDIELDRRSVEDMAHACKEQGYIHTDIQEFISALCIKVTSSATFDY